MTYPSKERAEMMWKDVVEKRKGLVAKQFEEEYVAHTKNVAFCAEKIADKCGLNKEKAYVFGLLHDIGKRQSEHLTGVFHAKDGYSWMLEQGYFSVAKICLTHTFILKPIKRESFTQPVEWLDWADDLLKDIEYDDYDKLIQLCDLFAEGLSIVSLEDRFEGIAQRYKLSAEQKEDSLNQARMLKDYFDAKCKCDIYNIIGVNK